jgi:hypothetical protein
MAEQQEKKKSEKAGRNDTKCKRYRVNKVREKHKVKRVLQSSGIIAAEKYADEHDVWSYFRKLTSLKD